MGYIVDYSHPQSISQFLAQISACTSLEYLELEVGSVPLDMGIEYEPRQYEFSKEFFKLRLPTLRVLVLDSFLINKDADTSAFWRAHEGIETLDLSHMYGEMEWFRESWGLSKSWEGIFPNLTSLSVSLRVSFLSVHAIILLSYSVHPKSLSS